MLRDAGRHLVLTIADLRREYGITHEDLEDPDRLPIGYLFAYLSGLSADARLVQALAAEQEAANPQTPGGGVIGVSAAGHPVVARGPGPRTVIPTDGELERGAHRGIFEVIG